MSRSQTIFVIITLVMLALIGYLGFRTLNHEILLRHYQAQTLAQARTTQVATYISGVLRQKAARLDAISGYLQLDSRAALRELVSKDSDIEAVFVMQRNQLRYPDKRAPLSKDEQEWVRIITPLVQDPSLLYSHSVRGEGETPQSGWFITYETQEPLLIYWHNLGSVTVGFRVSYIGLMVEIPGGLHQYDDKGADDVLRVMENGRLLYQSRDANISAMRQLDARVLPYPLNAWQAEVFGKNASVVTIYAWGGLFLLLLLTIVTLIAIRIYREYTRSALLARQQVNFVSQVSHELKTPLTNITLYAELLREALDEEQEAERRYVDVITSEGQRLSRLIQNILSFTRAPKLHWQPVEVGALMQQVAHVFAPSFATRDMTIRVSGGEGIVLESDRDRLTQIVSNFLSNAEKYAAKGGKVDLTVEENGEYVDIHVRDYGGGVAEKELKLMFRPFYRIKSAITEGVSGTGIGLTIAMQLARSLHGDIRAVRAEPGLCITLRLPRRRPAAQGENHEDTDRRG